MPIKIYTTKTISKKQLKQVFERSSADYWQIIAQIRPKVASVRQEGDQAILKKYQQRQIPINDLLLSKSEIKEAYQQIDKNFIPALNQAIKNIQKVHQAQKSKLIKEKKVLVMQRDIQVWRSWQAIERVGLYVPGGKANYPSSLLMTAIPAQIAGCNDIIVCVPPNQQGRLPPEVIITANKLGIKKVFKVGGAQAIAAMAYGTESIPKVYKIVGPGNQYVTAAKLLLFPTIDIDMPAGPSENLIIADESANNRFVAADLITDAEHGDDSTAILLITSMKQAESVKKEIARILPTLASENTIRSALKNYGAIIVTDNLEASIDLSNQYAPEHLQIMTKNALQIAKQITNAGSIFIGNWTCKASGDYATGANHVLPTGQSAKMFGPLSVESFGRLIQFQKASKKGLKDIKNTINTFAQVEALPAHAYSCQVRFEK
ncbi:MAG: histidinol dehydrogenase [Candidatus Woesebacteria bacterium]|jgi:histidinol dehydrogenase